MLSGPPQWITSYDLSFLPGIALTLGTLWSPSWRKVPAEWWCICFDSKFHRFCQYETNFYNQFPALGIFPSCQDINLITKFKHVTTCGLDYSWEISPHLQNVRKNTLNPLSRCKSLHSSSPSYRSPGPSSYPSMNVSDPTPGARFLWSRVLGPSLLGHWLICLLLWLSSLVWSIWIFLFFFLTSAFTYLNCWKIVLICI